MRRATPGRRRRAARPRRSSPSPTPTAARTPAGSRRSPPRRRRQPGALLAGPVRMDAAGGAQRRRRSSTWCAASRRRATSPAAMPPAPTSRCRGRSSPPSAASTPAGAPGGDADFCRRAGRAGHPLRLVAGAVVAHPARADWAELAAKARRVKGGQVAAGPLPRRAAWVLRSLCPPLTDSRLILAAPFPRPTACSPWPRASASGGSSSPRSGACFPAAPRSGGNALEILFISRGCP